MIINSIIDNKNSNNYHILVAYCVCISITQWHYTSQIEETSGSLITCPNDKLGFPFRLAHCWNAYFVHQQVSEWEASLSLSFIVIWVVSNLSKLLPPTSDYLKFAALESKWYKHHFTKRWRKLRHSENLNDFPKNTKLLIYHKLKLPLWRFISLLFIHFN